MHYLTALYRRTRGSFLSEEATLLAESGRGATISLTKAAICAWKQIDRRSRIRSAIKNGGRLRPGRLRAPAFALSIHSHRNVQTAICGRWELGRSNWFCRASKHRQTSSLMGLIQPERMKEHDSVGRSQRCADAAANAASVGNCRIAPAQMVRPFHHVKRRVDACHYIN